jgi:hypothetical protein
LHEGHLSFAFDQINEFKIDGTRSMQREDLNGYKYLSENLTRRDGRNSGLQLGQRATKLVVRGAGSV